MNNLEEFYTYMTSILGNSNSYESNVLCTPVSDADAICHLFNRFGFHLLVCFFIVHFCYFRRTKNLDYYKSFIFFASGMFLLLYLLDSIRLQIGLTLGLFAIFGVIRYRTETVPIKEMTYLFMIIVISVINGLSLNVSYLELFLANLSLAIIMCLFEYQKVFSKTSSKLILYDRIDLILPEQRNNMIEDLKKRTGLNVVSVEIGHVDFLKDTAIVKMFYLSDIYENNTIGHITKLKP